jgi:predicted phosphate transport protein (TIGR00153 family)
LRVPGLFCLSLRDDDSKDRAMIKLFQALLPKEDKFFDLFEAHAQTLCDGARVLRQLMDGGDAVPALCADVARYENDADMIARDVLQAVRRTFITPFDRSDIRDLISSMDDAIDQMHKTAKAIMLFEQTRFEPAMAQMADCAVKAADLTAQALPLLRQLSNNSARINQLTEQIVQTEEESDRLYDQGMQALYRGPGRADPMAFIVGSEIYDHLEKVADRFEDVANRISGVLIENL